MPVSLSWRRSGAAAMAKPRDTLSARLFFMDVSNCARLRPFRLSGPVGRVCKATRESRRRLLPASSRACVLIDVKMNGRSEPLNTKRSPRGFQPGSQISQYERPGRAASVPGIKNERLCIAAAASLVMWWCRRLLPASSRACVLIDVKMNGRSEPLNTKRSPRGFQPGSQISQYERPGRAASVPGIKNERLCIAAAASLVMWWSFYSTQASLVPNGGSSVLVLSACAKAVCRVYVRISLPTIVQLASRPRTTRLCCASSI